MTDTEARRKFEEAYQAAIDRGFVSTKRLCWQIWQAALDSVVEEHAATVKESLTVGSDQHALDSAELRRLCAERDQLWADIAEYKQIGADYRKYIGELHQDANDLRAELSESRKNFAELQAELLASDTAWSDEMELRSKLEAELAAIRESEPFAWAEFDGEGGYDLRLYEYNETFHDEYIKRNGAKYRDWVQPLYTAPQPQPDVQARNAELVDTLKEERDQLRAELAAIRASEPVDYLRGRQRLEQEWCELQNLKAAYTPQPQPDEPEGWRLVPIEPLINMMSDKDHDTRIIAERQLLTALAAYRKAP